MTAQLMTSISWLQCSLHAYIHFLSGFIHEDLGALKYVFAKVKTVKFIRDKVYCYKYLVNSSSLSSFNKNDWNKVGWKVTDLYEQVLYLEDCLSTDKSISKNEYARVMKSACIESLMPTKTYSKYYAMNKEIKLLPIYSLAKYFNEHNIKPSKFKYIWQTTVANILRKDWNKTVKIINQNKSLNDLFSIAKLEGLKNKRKKRGSVADLEV